MSTVAVLLIVGAAVIGPIESQPRTACSGEIPPRCDMPMVDAKTGRPLMESIPELCERAMKEIGAVTARCIPVPAGYRK